MVTFLSIAVTLLMFGCGILFFTQESSKAQLSLLRKLNLELKQEVDEYKAKKVIGIAQVS